MDKLSEILKEEFNIDIKGERMDVKSIFENYYVSTDSFKRLLPFLSCEDIMDIITIRKFSDEEVLMIRYFPKALYYLLARQKISEDVLEEIIHNDDFRYSLNFQVLSEDFIERHKDNLEWSGIVHSQKLSEKFLEEHLNYVRLDFAAKFQVLSEEFMKKHWNKDMSYYAVQTQKLSEDFINYLIDNLLLNKNAACKLISYQNLNEDMIEKILCNYPNFEQPDNKREILNNIFDCIARFQKLSPEFILKHFDDFDLRIISKFQNVSDIKEKILSSLPDKNRIKKIIKDNWIYKSAEEKKQEVNNTELYECYDDYFIAYKAIRPDRYSLFNFKYKYEPGGIYESWCDCSDNKFSFGLSLGTEEAAKNYLNGKIGIISKCKIRYEDVGRIVHKGDKIRCFKIEVLD